VKVFISWSGAAEGRVAKVLREALHTVSTNSVEAFVSSIDISRGDRGVVAIEGELAKTDYGIVVLSAENKNKPWINYEGGALATMVNRRVATILLDLRTAEVDTPLAGFQATLFNDRESVLTLFTEIVQSSNPNFPLEAIETLFDSQWDKIQASWQPSTARHKPRSERDMLEEVVNEIRVISRDQRRLANTMRATSTAGLSRQTPLVGYNRNYGDYLLTGLSQELGGRVSVQEAHRMKHGWRVVLKGRPEATRQDFEYAHFLVHSNAPDGQEIKVVMPMAPSDPAEGLFDTDQLGTTPPPPVN
jgi:hypothetical protein